MPTYHLDVSCKRNEVWITKNTRLRTDYCQDDKQAKKKLKKAAKHLLSAGNYDKVSCKIQRAGRINKKAPGKTIIIEEFSVRKKK